MKTVKNSEYSSMWHLHGLASVLGVQVVSIYPTYGGFTVRGLLNRTCVPRKAREPRQNTCTSIHIMWTNLAGRLSNPNGWLPNHFVAVGPVSEW